MVISDFSSVHWINKISCVLQSVPACAAAAPPPVKKNFSPLATVSFVLKILADLPSFCFLGVLFLFISLLPHSECTHLSVVSNGTMNKAIITTVIQWQMLMHCTCLTYTQQWADKHIRDNAIPLWWHMTTSAGMWQITVEKHSQCNIMKTVSESHNETMFHLRPQIHTQC